MGVALVGVASSHDHRGKMPLPQKKFNFIGSRTSALRFVVTAAHN
jgi:hypothetical protein